MLRVPHKDGEVMIKSRAEYIKSKHLSKEEMQQIILELAKKIEDLEDEVRIVKGIDWEKIRRFF